MSYSPHHRDLIFHSLLSLIISGYVMTLFQVNVSSTVQTHDVVQGIGSLANETGGGGSLDWSVLLCVLPPHYCLLLRTGFSSSLCFEPSELSSS